MEIEKTKERKLEIEKTKERKLEIEKILNNSFSKPLYIVSYSFYNFIYIYLSIYSLSFIYIYL